MNSETAVPATLEEVVIPPPPLEPGQFKVPNGDGIFIIHDERGIPLGFLVFDDLQREWVFIPNFEIPLYPDAGLGGGGTWALLNLVTMALSASATLAMFLLLTLRKSVAKKEEESEDEAQKRQLELKHRKKQWKFAFGSLGAVLAGFIIFVLTQDMTLQVAISDLYTLVHLALLACSLYALSKVKRFKNKTEAQSEDRFEELETVAQTTAA